jgi:hypothetical protein
VEAQSSAVRVFHKRLAQRGTSQTDAVVKIIRTVGHGEPTAGESSFAQHATRLTPERIVRIAAGLGVALAPADVDQLMLTYAPCTVTSFVAAFLSGSI